MQYAKTFPRSYEKHSSLQQIPVEIRLNVLNILVHFHSFCFVGFFLGGGIDFMQVSAEILYSTSPFHQPNIFTPQRMEKSASYAESHVCKRRQSSWPQVTLQSQQSTGEVQRHLKTSENRRAVQDTTRKKQKKSLRSNALFHTAAREVL